MLEGRKLAIYRAAVARTTLLAIAALLVGLGVAPSAVMAHSLKEFEDRLQERERFVQVMNVEPPAFTLSDTEGRSVSLSDFRGKVVVLYFAYARCKELCPLQSDFVASIQEQINEASMRDLVQVITVATDTNEDESETVEIMRGYARRHGFDKENWVFLWRGGLDPDATRKLAEKYGGKYRYNEEGDDQQHGTITYLIDKQGMLRARYHGLYFDPANLISQVNALASGQHEE